MKKMKAKKQNGKPYWEMNADELAEATKEFDRPIPESKLRPLTAAERREFERLQAGPSRSIYLKPRKQRQVKVKLDQELLRRSEDYASRHKMTLSDVISKSLVVALSFAE
jgi:hypothetical protein